MLYVRRQSRQDKKRRWTEDCCSVTWSHSSREDNSEYHIKVTAATDTLGYTVNCLIWFYYDLCSPAPHTTHWATLPHTAASHQSQTRGHTVQVVCMKYVCIMYLAMICQMCKIHGKGFIEIIYLISLSQDNKDMNNFFPSTQNILGNFWKNINWSSYTHCSYL